MSDLQEGTDYLYFPKAYYAGGKITGATNAEACAVCTPRYVFVLPKKDFTHYLVAMRTRTYNYFGEGVGLQQGLEALLAEDGLTVNELEERLVGVLGGEEAKDRVFKVEALKKFNITAIPILGQARMKHASGGGTKVLTCKGKGAMKRFKAFYEAPSASS